MRKLLFAGVAIGALSSSGAAWAQFDLFPNFGQDTAGPSLLFTYTDSGATTTSNPAYGTAAHPYDGAEDTYFGVINNSGAPITTIPLTSSLDIAGFDGDGMTPMGRRATPWTRRAMAVQTRSSPILILPERLSRLTLSLLLRHMGAPATFRLKKQSVYMTSRPVFLRPRLG
jgi:hypothetical protein